FDNINIDEISSYKLLYDEIYKENFITDKLEIARNILSIYLIKSSTLYIDDKVIKSIRSNYNIYLRENYDKYIELKMQTVSSLLDLQKEFSKIGNDISDNFIKNLGTLVTFLFTAIILNSLNNDSFTSLFTSDITKVSITILILSTIFVIYTYKLSKKSISDIEHLYTNISCIYNDLLDSSEVENITEKSYYTETKKNLDSKLKWYRNVWIVILPILFISTFTLGYTHIINWVNYFLNHIFK
uniref:hypothetical protein n=1 Tax=Clostridium sp. Ade.TY TaxID=1391647 RepID=UPI000465AE00